MRSACALLAAVICMASRAPAPAATLEWAVTYDGPGSDIDQPYALAVDSSGNSIATGIAGYDMVTVKRDPAGALLWAVPYDGPGNGYDCGYAVAVDPAGCVYVSGPSYGGVGSHYDITTIKYSPSGAQLWLDRYDGTGHGQDDPWAMGLDAAGNLYVVGTSPNATNPARPIDIVMIKYDDLGTRLWVARYDGPAGGQDWALDMKVDAAGNTCVAGWSDNFGLPLMESYVTLKYDTSGTLLWSARYNTSGTDLATAIFVDGSGNVYTTGYSEGQFATVKYDPSGSEVWVRRTASSAGYPVIAGDPSGNVWVSGRSANDYLTLKYAPDGTQEWSAIYDGPGHDVDKVEAIAVDPSGNAIVTGFSKGLGLYDELATLKFDALGSQVWAAREELGDPSTPFALSASIGVDPENNPIVASYKKSNVTSMDILMIKYGSGVPSISVSAPDAGTCGLNRWMPFWLEVRGGCPVASGSEKVHGFEFWLEHDPAAVAFDNEGNGYGDDLSFSDGVCQWSCAGETLGPDQYYAQVVDDGGKRYLHVGAVFDDDDLDGCEKSLGDIADDSLLLKVRFQVLDFPPPGDPLNNTTDFAFRTGEYLPYYAKLAGGGVPEEAQVTAPEDLLDLEVGGGPLFVRGNANGSSVTVGDPTASVDLSDGVYLLQAIFQDGPEPPCLEAADASDDGRLNLLDAVFILQWRFGGSRDLAEPFRAVGPDCDGDGLGCAVTQI
jgi:hypothetical protein